MTQYWSRIRNKPLVTHGYVPLQAGSYHRESAYYESAHALANKRSSGWPLPPHIFRMTYPFMTSGWSLPAHIFQMIYPFMTEGALDKEIPSMYVTSSSLASLPVHTTSRLKKRKRKGN